MHCALEFQENAKKFGYHPHTISSHRMRQFNDSPGARVYRPSSRVSSSRLRASKHGIEFTIGGWYLTFNTYICLSKFYNLTLPINMLQRGIDVQFQYIYFFIVQNFHSPTLLPFESSSQSMHSILTSILFRITHNSSHFTFLIETRIIPRRSINKQTNESSNSSTKWNKLARWNENNLA